MTHEMHWFNVDPSWDRFIVNFRPKKILEVGCHSGKTTSYLIENLAKEGGFEIFCIDPWEDYDEPNGSNMAEIEVLFDQNTLAALTAIRKLGVELKVIKCRGHSWAALPDLLSSGHRNYFDLAYIDGSHKAADVLFDAIFSFELIRIGGVLIFDDYLWSEVSLTSKGLPQNNLSRNPKIAIDGFTSSYFDKLKIINATTSQVVVQKIAI
jgi:predicted O-methyltransferase YrrM